MICSSAARVYCCRRREGDPDAAPIPRHIECELRAYLECGILACGFARAPGRHALRFHPAADLDSPAVSTVQRRIRSQVLRVAVHHGALTAEIAADILIGN